MQKRANFRHGFLLAALVLGIVAEGFFSYVLAVSYCGWAVGDAADGYGTILYTEDSGATWKRQGQAGVIPNVGLFSVSAVSPATAWVVGANIDGYGTILHTTDRGKTWKRQGSPAEVPDAELLKVKAVDAHVAWAVGDHGTVLRTTDGGETWEQVGKDPIPDIMLQGLDALDANTAWVSGAAHNGEGAVYLTTDGGATWSKQGSANGVPKNSHFLGISAADASHVWAVGGGGFLVIHTQNGGALWTLQSGAVGEQDDANEVDAVDRRTAWVAQDNDHILLTLDGGENWVDRGPHPVTGRYMMGVSAADANTAWVVGTSWGPYGGIIVRTTDGGLTWDRKTPPASEGEVPPNLYGISMVAESVAVPALSRWGALLLCLLMAGSVLWMTGRRNRSA